jgi:hypothetical protein
VLTVPSRRLAAVALDPPAVRALPALLRLPVLVPLATAVAAVSLLAGSSPTYDVWAWLVWGREIAHGQLETETGPGFKPLAVAVTTLLAPFGDAAPQLWLVLARAGSLVALGAAARLAWRVAGPVAAWIAGVSFVTITWFVGYLLPHGMADPLGVALVFLAVDLHLDRRYRRAFWLLVAAALLRPEPWPFVFGYALLLWRGHRVFPVPLAAGLVLIPVAWYLPELLSTGNPFRTVERAQDPTSGGPLLTEVPARAVLGYLDDGLWAWVEVGALLAVVIAIPLRDRVVLTWAGFAAGWALLVAGMAQLNVSSGISRYLFPVWAMGCVLAGVGWVHAVRLVPAGPGRRTRPLAAGLVVLAAVPAAVSFLAALPDHARQVRHQQGGYEALPRALAAAGGADAVFGCGMPGTAGEMVPYLAWLTDRHLKEIGPWPTFQGALLQTRVTPRAPLGPEPYYFLTYRRLGSATAHGVPWVVLTSCPG